MVLSGLLGVAPPSTSILEDSHSTRENRFKGEEGQEHQVERKEGGLEGLNKPLSSA